MRGEYLKQKHLWEQQMTCMELAKNKVKKNSTPGHKIKGKATPRVWAEMQRNSHTKVNIIITHAAYQPLLDPKLWSIKWLNCIISSVQPVYPLRMQFYTKLTSLKSIHLPQQLTRQIGKLHMVACRPGECCSTNLLPEPMVWCTCTRQGKIPICYILKGIAKAKQHTEIKQPRYQNMLQLSWPPKKQAQNKL